MTIGDNPASFHPDQVPQYPTHMEETPERPQKHAKNGRPGSRSTPQQRYDHHTTGRPEQAAPALEPFADLLRRPGWRVLALDDIEDDDPDAGFARIALEMGATLIEWTRERAEADRLERGL